MITLASHGTATRATTTLMHWRAAVDEIVCHEIGGSGEDEIDEVITRERLWRWFEDGMTVAMAVGTVKTWILCSRPARKADREERSLRRMLAMGRR